MLSKFLNASSKPSISERLERCYTGVVHDILRNMGHWLPEATDVEIRIGEVDIAPGDYLLGDRDGLLRIPQGVVEEVILASEEAMNKESLVRQAILQGVDPQEAYLKYGKF